mgnify:CR=1 FL=1
MKLGTLLAGLGLAGIASVANAEGFKIDVSKTEVFDKAGILSVGSLAVGEKGLLTFWGARFCRTDDGVLKVSVLSKLEDSPSEYSYLLEVERKAGNAVDINDSASGKGWDLDAGKSLLSRVVQAPSCSYELIANEQTLVVNQIAGRSSISSILVQIKAPSVSKNREVQPKAEITSVTKIPEEPQWIVNEDNSEIDDSPTVLMFLSAKGIGSSFGDETLILRCKENKTDAFVGTDEYLGRESSSALVRFDQVPAYKQRTSVSTDSKSIFVAKPIAFIKKLMKHERMVVRYSTYRGTEKTAIFALSGFEEGLGKLRAACNW